MKFQHIHINLQCKYQINVLMRGIKTNYKISNIVNKTSLLHLIRTFWFIVKHILKFIFSFQPELKISKESIRNIPTLIKRSGYNVRCVTF